jgi:hypothetical protein
VVAPPPTATVPARTVTTLPPAAPSVTLTVGAGVATALVGARALHVAGNGPGEAAGAGMALTLAVSNHASRPRNLDAVSVTASAGGREGSLSEGPPAQPFAGTLAPGATRRGVYVFVLPSGAVRPVAVVLSLAPDLPVARFTVR